MSILQRFICTTTKTTTASTIRLTICKTPKQLHLLPRLSLSTTPASSGETISIQKSSKDATKKTNWTIVYRFPMIRWASAFNRLKSYQLIITTAGIPGAFVLENAELLPVGSSAVVGALGISGIITLALGSLAVQNLIGFIYINKDKNKLRFAYVDYWGRRQDTIVDINDVVPDGAQENRMRASFYQKISLQSDEKLSFKLLQHYGIIVEPEIFSALFY